MGRKSKKSIVVEEVLHELYKQNGNLKMAIRIEELLNCATGEERILYNTLLSHIEFSHTVYKNFIKSDEDMVKYLIISAGGFLSSESTVDYIENILKV